jgi:hypothetical protein
VLQFRRVLREYRSRVRLFLSHSGTFCSARFLDDDAARAIAYGGELSLHGREPRGLIVRMQLQAWQQPRLAA